MTGKVVLTREVKASLGLEQRGWTCLSVICTGLSWYSQAGEEESGGE